MSENKLAKFWKEHGSLVLTIVSVGCSVAAPILSANATPKAVRAIQEAEQAKGEPLDGKEKFKAGWKYYIPTALVTAAAVGSSIGAHAKDQNTITNISTAYNVLSTSAQIFEQKVAENVSADKLGKIREEVAKEKVKEGIPEKTKQLYLNSGDSDNVAWFKDDFSKRYFKSDTVTLESIKNNINNIMLNEGYVCLNEWYIQVGLDPIELGWDVGWHATIPGELMNFHVDYTALEDGTPCGVIIFSPMPGPRNGSYIG